MTLLCPRVGLPPMDRILLAIIASSVLLLLGAAGLYVDQDRRPLKSRPHSRGRWSK